MKKYQRIEDLRIDADLTQDDMAKKMDTSRTQYQRYENSLGNNFFDAIIMIAKIHKVSIDYIAGLTNDKGGLHKNSIEEQEVLKLYNSLSEKEKGRILERMDIMIKKKEKTKNVKIQQGNNNKNNININ